MFFAKFKIRNFWPINSNKRNNSGARYIDVLLHKLKLEKLSGIISEGAIKIVKQIWCAIYRCCPRNRERQTPLEDTHLASIKTSAYRGPKIDLFA